MRVLLHKTAAKQLAALPERQQQRVREKLRLLRQHGLAAPVDIKRLQGRPGYRLRVGKIRVIFRIRDDAFVVMEIGPRGGVYRK